ncbi:MAG: cob(I)yrinic acid a,c-diamide adenosyltransferase [Bacteroidales bacterium]|nr:cob(I)yrinic acid a,c-diamide adenosyltransferase [Bacteroidales bacterium]
MKIYTKKGDKGETSLIGGKRISKDHIRIEAYGTVDELIAYVGLLRDQLEFRLQKDELIQIQDHLMVCAAMLAYDGDDPEVKLPKLSAKAIVWVEQAIDEMEKQLEVLDHFILPGGHPVVSQVHIARTVCRRAERRIVSLNEVTKVDECIIQYFNRLSDYLFVLARFASDKLGAGEIPWKTRFV